MVRHSRSKRAKKLPVASRKKDSGHILRVIFLSVSVGVIVFIAGSYFFPPKPPCANSRSCNDYSEKIENGAIGVFHGRKILPPPIDLAYEPPKPSVLGTNVPDGEKHIYVDLSSQKLFAYQGNTKVMETFISSGKWNRTPQGDFRIWHKVRSTRMSGGSGNDAYDLPNVPYVMFFYRDFALHGAYWHNNFGHPMSHGCVNMRPVDAGELFVWADGPGSGEKGTEVSICSSFTAPNTCVQGDSIN